MTAPDRPSPDGSADVSADGSARLSLLAPNRVDPLFVACAPTYFSTDRFAWLAGYFDRHPQVVAIDWPIALFASAGPFAGRPVAGVPTRRWCRQPRRAGQEGSDPGLVRALPLVKAERPLPATFVALAQGSDLLGLATAWKLAFDPEAAVSRLRLRLMRLGPAHGLGHGIGLMISLDEGQIEAHRIGAPHDTIATRAALGTLYAPAPTTGHGRIGFRPTVDAAFRTQAGILALTDTLEVDFAPAAIGPMDRWR